jgi:predicted nuclease of predicted toxin-antitoxin system
VKVLLDECLPIDFRHSFPSHEAHTAEWAGLKGRKNGDLLRSAEAAGYDVLLTVDQGISHQQPPANRRISIILIRARTNQLEDLLPWSTRSSARWGRQSRAGRVKFPTAFDGYGFGVCPMGMRITPDKRA